MKQSQRKVTVLFSLAGLLTLASVLLLVLAPPPLASDGLHSLSAEVGADFLEQIFKTSAPAQSGRWKFIYIHHSATPAGNASTLARRDGGLGDHFVIGNGDGCQDGEIQIGSRWNLQLEPFPPQGAQKVDPDCISICLIGDLDRTAPTPLQLRRLAQLVTSLQSQLRIPGDRVVWVDQPGQAAGVGKLFPVGSFRDQVLP